MFGYLVVLELLVFASIQARPSSYDLVDTLLEQNDANLNQGFDIDAFRDNQLDLHNYYRSLHGVPAMTRDETLTTQAQSYAETLAATEGSLVHCTLPDCDRHGAGENLARAWGSTTVETNATKAWYDEIWWYDYCSNNGDKRPGFEASQYMVGHFTQVIWKSSTKLGIGYARSSDRTMVYVVGRYLDHGNVGGQYLTEVTKPDYILSYYQNTCTGTNGGLSAWSSPGECSRSCGGGIRFQTRTCTNPKPSLNGADCTGTTKQLVVEWCNVQTCSGDESHRDLQCEARGKVAKAYNFGGTSDCQLYCQQSVGSYTYMGAGNVDDGTHCNSHSGACLEGVCTDMPDYVPSATAAPTTEPVPVTTTQPPVTTTQPPVVTTTQPPVTTTQPPVTTTQPLATTTAPSTSSSNQVTGAYSSIPSSILWDNKFFEIPDGATNVLVRNDDYDGVQIFVGYRHSAGGGYNFGEQSWMSYYIPYTIDYTTKGVSYTYNRYTGYSTFSFTDAILPETGYTIVLYANTTSQSTAQITWSYTAPPPVSTTPHPTSATGQLVGTYTQTPSSTSFSENIFFEIPDGATGITVTNNDYDGVQIYLCDKNSEGSLYCEFGEYSWLSNYALPLSVSRTAKGVSYTYNRQTSYSTFTISGPVEPDTGYTIVFYAQGASPADISWTYSAPVSA